LELANIHPHPPAVRVFDAGIGDGTVLSPVMRAMHHNFRRCRSISRARKSVSRMCASRSSGCGSVLRTHPATRWFSPTSPMPGAMAGRCNRSAPASSLIWHELRLMGNSSHEFEEQISELEPFLSKNWKAGISPRTGNPSMNGRRTRHLSRDHRFLLDSVIPKPGGTRADFDLVVASQPYRARSPLEFKASRVIAPLARALGPGGRLIGIHSHGEDPGARSSRASGAATIRSRPTGTIS